MQKDTTVFLTNVTSNTKPASGWNVIEKPDDRILYVPCSSVYFSWTSVKQATLYTNYPDCYSNELRPIESCCYKTKEHQWEAKLEVTVPGNFQLQMKLDDGRSSSIGYFLVEPKLEIDLSSIVCETVLTKALGPFSRWGEIFDRIASLQYNMVHFTPVQALGVSRSCYSLYDHQMLTEQLVDNDEGSLTEEEKEKKLTQFLEKYAENGVYSICDVVWNHTAINTPWICDHPLATYNLQNSPHLRPAYCLDRALQRLHRKLARRYEIIVTEEDVDRIIREIQREILPSLKLWEFFILDISNEIERFKNELLNPSNIETEQKLHPFASEITEECIIQGDGRRASKQVSLPYALQLTSSFKSIDEKCLAFRRALDKYNDVVYDQWSEDEKFIIESLRNHLMYHRIDPNGPKRPLVSNENPLFFNYFTTLKEEAYLPPSEDDFDNDSIHDLRIDGADNFACANAGWVFGLDNTIDLTGPKHRIYLRRQLVVWTDCLRLRYGDKPSDSPFLWEYMKEYTCQIARMFHGVRIDNCHSTPLPVARYLLQAARSVRPNLMVVAELFTQPKIEVQYCEQLGLTCLIREAMQVHTPSDFCSQVYAFNGGSRNAIGSLFPSSVALAKDPFQEEFEQREVLYGKTPRIIYMNCTHDNEPPAVNRVASDALPTATLVAMTNCAIGSVLGFDQLVPHRVDVVTEERLYPTETIGGGMEVSVLLLNSLHRALASKGYSEFHVHQEGDLVLIVRHNPSTLKSVYVLVHCAFQRSKIGVSSHHQSFEFSGEFVEELFVGVVRTDKIQFEKNENFINGLIPTLYWPHQGPTTTVDRQMYHIVNHAIQPTKFPAGAVLGISTTLPKEAEEAKTKLFERGSDDTMENIINEYSLIDMQKILFTCDREGEFGTYNINNWGNMSYSGLAGIVLCFNSINEEQTVSHPICDNLRDGFWLLNYTADRLNCFPKLSGYLTEMNSYIKKLYSFLVPKFFHWFISRIYYHCVQRVMRLMSPFIQQGNSFTKALALCSVQMYGNIDSAPLSYRDIEAGNISPSLAAGLPHFSSGYMRTWGRDTFISLRGLMLVTGRFDDALYLINGFASCLRHGLIPNLLASGKGSRFNARDAVWWFTQAVQDYCEFAFDADPEKTVAFLQSNKVIRNFPCDDIQESEVFEGQMESSLAEILEEILRKHAAGISFREWNAGEQIDQHMVPKGFNVSVRCDPENGFIFGGNKYNCGTWMDKMGESVEFGSMGKPSTPRDGADIEIIGLLASTLRWMSSLTSHGLNNPVLNVGIVGGKTFTYSQWYETIQKNFEKCFWVPQQGSDDCHFDVDVTYIIRRGMYKDTYGGSDPCADYCFRPNQCVAMVVAPELFTNERVTIALENIRKVLLGKLGMKTLDPCHPRYSPYYDMQSKKNYYEAKGFNYHQGPEWLWPIGYFLRARLQFETTNSYLFEEIDEILREHKEHIRTSKWGGLPELTNKGGEHCNDSCPTQAWSAATILDTLYDIYSKA